MLNPNPNKRDRCPTLLHPQLLALRFESFHSYKGTDEPRGPQAALAAVVTASLASSVRSRLTFCLSSMFALSFLVSAADYFHK